MESLISFYHNVYAQELSNSKTLHLDASKIVKRHFVEEKEELLNNETPYLPLSDKVGENLLKIFKLRRNELRMVYFSMIRISRFLSVNKQPVTRVYPLFSTDAEIFVKEGLHYLKVDKSTRVALNGNIPSKVTSHPKFQYLMENTEGIDIHFSMQLADVIDATFDGADTSELRFFPDLWSLRKVNAAIEQPFEVGDKYIPCGIIALIEKEYNAFHSLGELNLMRQTNSYSRPLRVLFDGEKNVSDEKLGIVCEELNHSQYKALQNSNANIVSVISGPPGTGKSYTIANLTAEKVSKGASVLITSKNKEALDVIEEKIKDQIGIDNLCVNPSSDGTAHFIGMSRYLDYILGRKFVRKNYAEKEIDAAFENYQNVYDTHSSHEDNLHRLFEREKKFYQSLLDRKFTGSTHPDFHRKIMTHRSVTGTPLWEALNDYYGGVAYSRKTATKTLRKVAQFMLEEGIKKNRNALRHYQSFLRSRNPAHKNKLLQNIDYNAVLTTFPVWLVRAGDVSRVLPLQKEVFDLLIVDEASQCDIPSLLPLIQRAKKVIIVGDNKQLAHISFVSKDFEDGCRAEVKSDYFHLCRHRDYSVLDLAEDFVDPMAKIELNEHFRSQFPIISFSNQAFYNQNLDILTKRPISIAEHVEFIKRKGKRTTRGYNISETKGIVNYIENIIFKERDLPVRFKTSIGILSPFRKQVDYLIGKIMETFPVQSIDDHKIMVGTAFSFQGNERDYMLLSLSLDDDSVAGSFNFLNRKDVFNVSITRARNKQIVFYSFDPEKLKTDTTLAQFFRHYQRDLKDDTGRTTKDVFCEEVQQIFAKKGFKTWTNFNISGVSIDLLVQIEDQYLGIDLIGFPGEMEDYYSLERYKMIERGNIRLFPLSYPYWVGNPDKCNAALENLIQIIQTEEKTESETSSAQKALPETRIAHEESEKTIGPEAIFVPTLEVDNATYRISEKKIIYTTIYINISCGPKPVGHLNISATNTLEAAIVSTDLKRGHKKMELLHWMLNEAKPFIETTETYKKISTKGLDLTKREERVFKLFGFKKARNSNEMVLSIKR